MRSAGTAPRDAKEWVAMIYITIYKTSKGQVDGFKVRGHADSVSEGADLVCCSVSVLTINCANSLEQLTDTGFTVTEQEEEGLIELHLKQPASDAAELLMQSFVLGIETIEKQYGTWMKVVTEEV